MAKKSIKELRTDAEELAATGIGNKEALFAALPTLVDLQAIVAVSRKNLNAADTAAKKLSKLCTAYAVGHKSVFDGGEMHLTQQNVKTGDVTVDDVVYHLVCGYEGYERADGALKTQEFLRSLPSDWIKESIELNVTKINDANPTDEELAEAGLRQKPKNVWSVKE